MAFTSVYLPRFQLISWRWNCIGTSEWILLSPRPCTPSKMSSRPQTAAWRVRLCPYVPTSPSTAAIWCASCTMITSSRCSALTWASRTLSCCMPLSLKASYANYHVWGVIFIYVCLFTGWFFLYNTIKYVNVHSMNYFPF